ncbi:hypothetical protein NP233_g10990 [Leucocoprinus birnbaumii]|uniref:NFX1-type zinc finger-containing protein 1 n=1 Tax=Leucocoprinus birnbaumii TaxID=56174 RepID=A0AAD5YRD2_9AGAR|nr:hypothetical protein NP233_g10990 [Leucocoprinus birnbaumii]
MSYRQKLCRFYNSLSGCRNGDQCRFSHLQDVSSSQISSALVSPGQTRVPQSSRPNQGLDGVPRNTCQFFWKTGACARGFDCSYRHVKQSGTANEQNEATDVTVNDSTVDFFSPEGLAIGVGSIYDERHNLNPSEVHNHLKEFLRDHYHFDTAARVQGFVRVLASVNERNKSWNAARAQEFLEVVVKGNTIYRISDVLRFQLVSTTVGFHGGALSFQRGYFPIFQFFSCDFILKSTLQKNINTLYAVIKNDHNHIFGTLQTCLEAMMAAKSWKDTNVSLVSPMQNTLDGLTIFRTLTTVFLQYFQRYKDGVRSHSEIPPFIQRFSEWFNLWASDVSATPARFEDTITSVSEDRRKLAIRHLSDEIDRLLAIVERESGVVLTLKKAPTRSNVTRAQLNQAHIAQLAQTYDPPGGLRADGPRHDNDFEAIENIRIAPTHLELFSPIAPYMPVFSPNAPHHLAAGSMERHLDIQFRLLREELISTTRASVTAIHDDLLKKWEVKRHNQEKTVLEKLLDHKGGAYRTSGRESLFFHVYTNVEFLPDRPEARRNSVTVTLVIDAPPNPAAHDKDPKKRVAYWEHSRRFQGCRLVALVIVYRRTVNAYLGIVASFSQDIAESAKFDRGRIRLRVSFFDSKVELMALRGERLNYNQETFAILVDNSVMFETVRPFLQKLQTIEPTEIPFSRYIAPGGSLEGVEVLPPKYAIAPEFRFNLQCLARPQVTGIHDLDITDPLAVARARDQLKKYSVLDASQAEATSWNRKGKLQYYGSLLGTLLIEDTCQSFTAKEILRVLFSSKIRPIVLIAFTNHALDHMVTSVLDANITDKIVRLGSGSSDERVAEYALEKLERLATAPTLDRSIKQQYRIMKQLEAEMTKTMTSILLPLLSWEKIEEYLNIHYPEHADMFRMPPFWITVLAELKWSEEDELGEFTEVTHSKKGQNKMVEPSISRTHYGFWRQGLDLQFLQQRPLPSLQPQDGTASGEIDAKTEVEQQRSLLADPVAFFASLNYDDHPLPSVPVTDRQLSELSHFANVWAMSAHERSRLAEDLEQKTRKSAYDAQHERYAELRKEYKEAYEGYTEMRDEIRRRILSSTDLIACTTTGAASLTSLLSSIRPRVLMVEEAGQVLEAHILTSLGSSVHHLICIGDPCQLRPSLATYTLSMDSPVGKQLYKFDRSLMERLSDSHFPMSQINVQRRMRPTISHFIRTILYPNLEDNELVFSYPPVQGMQKDVFFFNHLNKENGTEDSVSKYNTFEVQMIRDLVVYFLHQGTYDGPGDIAVLCAYLGQLQKVRAALRDLKIAVTVNERDAEQLARQGIDEEVEYEEVVVAKHVRLGTVDIFQGQEAKIVIVSLVRNSGQIDTGTASIGFLKVSPNRINVALSRAKHGLYILGNASNLRQNPTWSTILDEMEDRDQIGSAFPIICPRHPEQARLVTKPGEIPLYAPVGGCTLPCNARLLCGHMCGSACHAALDDHRSAKCLEPCNRTPCPRRHPCSKRCFDDCGDCMFPMYDVLLPCGHGAAQVPCHLVESLALHAIENRNLFAAKNFAPNPFNAARRDVKPGVQNVSYSLSSRTHHPRLRGRFLVVITLLIPANVHFTVNTSADLTVIPKTKIAIHRVPNHAVNSASTTTARNHAPSLAVLICSRLPCDELCQKLLECGHPCPSVCGEICEMQKCVECLPEEQKADIVDFIMQRSLAEIDSRSDDVADRLITLACGHIFTVETLDGHCNMRAFYNTNDMGQFLSTKSPPIEYQTPPTCPTCRGPITALRYGRVTKRATLDILEQNVASTMSRALNKCNPVIVGFTSTIAASEEQAKKLEIRLDGNGATKQKREKRSQDVHGPLPAYQLSQDGMHQAHGFTLEEAREWYKIVKPLVVMYRHILKIAATRGAHVKAYEAALTTLYRLELRAIADDPEIATNTPEPLALSIVSQKIGQAPPKADVRYQVEAYFLSLEIRSLIAQLAQARIEGLTTAAKDSDVEHHRSRWTSFVTFLYKSCATDAEKAMQLATESSAYRQATRASIHQLRFEFELFRWEIMLQHSEILAKSPFDMKARDGLVERIKDHSNHISQAGDSIAKNFLRRMPSTSTLAQLGEARKWLDENCLKKTKAWQAECEKLVESIERRDFYQPMSTQEYVDIVKSFDFRSSGHFYNCQNGHPFVIADCGGAVQTSQVPRMAGLQSGAQAIGLIRPNTPNVELDAIARRSRIEERRQNQKQQGRSGQAVQQPVASGLSTTEARPVDDEVLGNTVPPSFDFRSDADFGPMDFKLPNNYANFRQPDKPGHGQEDTTGGSGTYESQFDNDFGNDLGENYDIDDVDPLDPFINFDISISHAKLKHAKEFIDLLDDATLENSGLSDDAIDSLHNPAAWNELDDNPELERSFQLYLLLQKYPNSLFNQLQQWINLWCPNAGLLSFDQTKQWM